jgi:hypothetical protein
MRVHPVFHASLLKKFVPRPGETTQPPPLVVEGEEEYEVEAVIGRRLKKYAVKTGKHSCVVRTRVEYLVKWKGYGPEHNQWLTETEVLRHAQEAVDEYLAGQDEEIQLRESRKTKPQKKT